jgi:hypothetical protein
MNKGLTRDLAAAVNSATSSESSIESTMLAAFDLQWDLRRMNTEMSAAMNVLLFRRIGSCEGKQTFASQVDNDSLQPARCTRSRSAYPAG